jgi:hypothetical protein
MKRLILISAAVAVASACAVKPQIQWEESYDFAAIDSFAWKQSPAAVSLENQDPFLHAHVVNAIEYYLTQNGLTEVESNPDVFVTYYGSTDTQTQLQSSSYGYSWGGYGRPGWGYYGYGRAGPAYTTTRVVEYQRGTLVVDIIDAASSELVWRGTVSDISVSDDPEKMRKNVSKAIAQMAKQAEKLSNQAG